MPSFDNKKALRFVITLGTGKFGSADNNQIILQGYRASIDIDKAGGTQMSTLRAKIYGVKQEDMNSITTLQWKFNYNIPNTVEVYAVDGKVETLVYAGNIVNSWGDYQNQPDVFLHIQAQSAFYNGLKPVPPRSFKGSVDVASVMGQIASNMGLAFENGGVQKTLSDIYLANTNLEQAKELAKMAKIGIFIDDKTLAITPSPTIPRGTLIPLISKDTGLIGYPAFDGIGVTFNCLFNPSITFGGRVKLDTSLPQAAGEWQVSSMSHRLESERPGGAWQSTVRGTPHGLAIR